MRGQKGRALHTESVRSVVECSGQEDSVLGVAACDDIECAWCAEQQC